MDILAREQQDIMWSLSHFYDGKPMDDIQINELFALLVDESDFDLSDWCLEFTDLHAIKYYNDDDFTKHLNYKYLIFDNADEEL